MPSCIPDKLFTVTTAIPIVQFSVIKVFFIYFTSVCPTYNTYGELQLTIKTECLIPGALWVMSERGFP